MTHTAASEPPAAAPHRRTFAAVRALSTNELVWASALLIVGALLARFGR